MKKNNEIKEIALSTIENEAKAIINLKNYIDNVFVQCVEQIYHSKGRVVLTGIGKSAIIASKIVATLNSTGTPAVFMHAADAIHGDLGIVQKDDIVICASKSGDTAEIKILLPFIKSLGNKIIALVGNKKSYLAENADYIIFTGVESEAYNNNLAPTSSTTAMMVMGDALAVCLLECRGLTISDFAKYHPGGMIGKKLYLRVADIYKSNEVPTVEITADIKTIIFEISSKRLGATAVLENGKLMGVITDGDLRRMLMNNTQVNDLIAKDIMTENPKTIDEKMLAVDALFSMRENNITQLIVTKKNVYLGIIHIHDLLKEGLI